MKSIALIFTLLISSFSFSQNEIIDSLSTGWALIDTTSDDTVFVYDVITIQYTESCDSACIASREDTFNLSVEAIDLDNFVHYEKELDYDLLEFLDSLMADSMILTAYINPYWYVHSTPGDYHLNQQNILDDINITDAWQLTNGCASPVISVIDLGIDRTHRDLGDRGDGWTNWRLNSGDLWSHHDQLNSPSTGNNLDDDSNGLIDDYLGWDYHNNDNDVLETTFNHGTNVVGIIGAKGGNGTGIAGIAGGDGASNPGNPIAPYNVGFEWPLGTGNWVIKPHVLSKAIGKISNSSSRTIINMSLGGPGNNLAVENAVKYASYKGHILVASVGNNNFYHTVASPAIYKEVIAVGGFSGTTASGGKTPWWRSNYNQYINSPDNVFVVGPSVNVYTTDANDTYAGKSGTSFAAPIVTAGIALALCENPVLTNENITKLLSGTAKKLSPSSNHVFNNHNQSVNYPCHNHVTGYGWIDIGQLVEDASKVVTQSSINTNTTWNTDKVVLDNLTISSGSTLTINADVTFHSEVELIVEAGAKLVVNNAVLNAYRTCMFWNGITVLGNSSASQVPLSSTPQGIIEINNATIKNARIGIYVGDRSQPHRNLKQGGIVLAENSDFVNCRRAVQFEAYANRVPGTNTFINNISYFEECTFETNLDYYHNVYNDEPTSQININNNDGIRIIGCSFINSFPYSFSSNPNTLHGIAINAFNSRVYVNGKCSSQTIPCPSGQLTQTTFQGYFEAINISGLSKLNASIIDQCSFEDCRTGVRVNGVDFVRISRCDFDLDIYTGGWALPSYHGIILNEASKYKVTENTFSGKVSAGQYEYGIYVDNKLKYYATNQIYKNTFENLFIACQGENDNRGRSTGASINPFNSEGLLFKCNDYTESNEFDIKNVLSPGISASQGANTATGAAGNIFDGCTPVNGELAIDGNPINYYHFSDASHTPSSGCYSGNTSLFDVSASFLSNYCSSKIANASTRIELLDSLTNHVSVLDSLEVLLENAIAEEDSIEIIDSINYHNIKRDFSLSEIVAFDLQSDTFSLDSTLKYLSYFDSTDAIIYTLDLHYKNGAGSGFDLWLDSISNDSTLEKLHDLYSLIAAIPDSLSLKSLLEDSSSMVVLKSIAVDSSLYGYMKARSIISCIEESPISQYIVIDADSISKRRSLTRPKEELKDVVSEKIKSFNPIIYPNPSNGIVHFKSNSETETKFEIFSIEGRLIMNSGFNNETTIESSRIGKGVFIVRFVTEDLESQTKRMIIQ